MFLFLVFLIAVIAVLLTITVLLQSGKGGGLAGIASGGQTQQILGARQAPDFLEKATWSLGSALLVLCLITSFFTGSAEQRRSIIQERASGLPAAPAPAPNATPLVPNEAAPGPEGVAPATPAPAAPAPAAPAPAEPAPQQ